MNPHELHDIADLDPDGLPTRASLLKAGALALAVAGMSFMPEGLEKQITVRDMADLLAYLDSLN